MGLNLGLAALAANSYFDQGKRNRRDQVDQEEEAAARADREERASRRGMRDNAAGLADAQVSANRTLLPEQTAQQIAAARLAAAQNEAGLSMIPERTALERNDLAFKQSQQPALQQLDAAKTGMAVKNIPGAQAANVQQRGNAADQRHLETIGKLHNFYVSNDKQGALASLNLSADAESLATGTKKKKFVDVRLSQDGAAYQALTDDGNTYNVPVEAAKQAAAMANTGEYSMHQGTQGDVQVLNKKTGKVTTAVPGDPNFAKRGVNAHDPADVATAKWLLTAGVAKTETEAWDKVRAAREKSKPAWIGEMIKPLLMPNTKPEDIQKYEEAFSLQYDRLHKTAPGLPSNSQSTPTIDPKYQSLFATP